MLGPVWRVRSVTWGNGEVKVKEGPRCSVHTRDLMGKAEIIVNKQGVISQVIRDNKVQKR